jgi:hypothetical protein
MRRHKISGVLISILLSVTSISAGEPHPYLIALANDITVAKETGIKMDLGPDLLSFSFRTKSYAIDSLLRNVYPSEIERVIGPSDNGFVIRITIGPKENLPMSRRDGIYTTRTIARPYWTERVYGYEMPEGTVAVSVLEGPKMTGDELMSLEGQIKEHLARRANKQ